MSSRWVENQKKYYDETAGEYGHVFQQDNVYFQFVTRRFLKAIAPHPGERILEFGASGGRFTEPLLKADCRVTAVDVSERSLEFLGQRAQAYLQDGRLVLLADDVGSLTKLRERNFDAVIGAHILHHVEDMEAVLRRALEFLRPGGRAIFMEPNPWNPQWVVHITIDPTRSWKVEKGLLSARPGKVRRAFMRAGFAQCRVECFGCFPPFVLNAMPSLESVENNLERTGIVSRLLTLNLFIAHKAGA